MIHLSLPQSVNVSVFFSALGLGVLSSSAFADAVAGDCRRFDMVERLPNDFNETASGLIPHKNSPDDEIFVFENASCECHNRVLNNLDAPGTPDAAIWSCISLAERDHLAKESSKGKR